MSIEERGEVLGIEERGEGFGYGGDVKFLGTEERSIEERSEVGGDVKCGYRAEKYRGEK